jgi:hypothetical protein
MRSNSLARAVMASLGVSVVVTLGCGKSSPAPSPSPTRFSVQSIFPTEGSPLGATVARIEGTGFPSGATVTVDGTRVDATVHSANIITLTMPAHASGKVDVTVINSLSQEQANVPGGYLYLGPVIRELLPNIGSTGGGTPMTISVAGMWPVVTVRVDGIVTDFDPAFTADAIYLLTPAHAAGTVEVILTDRYGLTASGVFTYASPATFDFNGDWQGWAHDPAPPPGAVNESARLVLTIRDNTAVSVSCSVCRAGENCSIGSAPSLTLDPPPVVANGEFSFAGSGGVTITGRILSPNAASGSITMPSCGSRQWYAYK